MIGTLRVPAFDFGFTNWRELASQLRSTRSVSSLEVDRLPVQRQDLAQPQTGVDREPEQRLVAGLERRSTPEPRRGRRSDRVPFHRRQPQVAGRVPLCQASRDRPAYSASERRDRVSDGGRSAVERVHPHLHVRRVSLASRWRRTPGRHDPGARSIAATGARLVGCPLRSRIAPDSIPSRNRSTASRTVGPRSALRVPPGAASASTRHARASAR